MTAETFTRLALALQGATEVPHFDRRAFKTRTTFATLAADGRTANLKLDRDQQDHWCALLPRALLPVPNKWGLQGWTTVQFDQIKDEDLALILHLAWSNTQGKPRR